MDIPTTLADVDAAFLSEVLGQPVEEVSRQRIAVGQGFLGELARVSLKYGAGGAGPATVITKIPTTDSGLKPLGLMLDLYLKEHRAYNEIIPELKVTTPKALYNGARPEDDLYCLILEDIGHLHSGDQLAGGTLEQARAAMKTAAGIHGRWWGRVDDLDWVPPIDSPLNLSLQSMYEDAFPMIVDQLGDLLGSDLMGHIERWIPTCSAWLEAYGAMSYTLTHYDFRLDNMFFDGKDLVLIDWQTIGRGDGLGDVCPFLSSNLDSELRRIHETDLLTLYHDAVNDLGGGYPDFVDLMMSYRANLNFWLCHWCFTAVTAGGTSERGEQLFERMVSRTADTVRDHESWELIGDHSWRPRL